MPEIRYAFVEFEPELTHPLNKIAKPAISKNPRMDPLQAIYANTLHTFGT